MKLITTIISSLVFGLTIMPQIQAKEKPKYHCEKKIDDKVKELPKADTRKKCKRAGGKWRKAHKKDSSHAKDHKHEKGHSHDDGHNHK